MVHIQKIKSKAARGLIAQDETGQQKEAAGGMDQEVAVAGGQRLCPSAEPDEKYRGECHQFPENKQGDVIGAKNYPERAGHIDPGGDVFLGILYVQAVDGADDAHQRHDIAEHPA